MVIWNFNAYVIKPEALNESNVKSISYLLDCVATDYRVVCFLLTLSLKLF